MSKCRPLLRQHTNWKLKYWKSMHSHEKPSTTMSYFIRPCRMRYGFSREIFFKLDKNIFWVLAYLELTIFFRNSNPSGTTWWQLSRTVKNCVFEPQVVVAVWLFVGKNLIIKNLHLTSQLKFSDADWVYAEVSKVSIFLPEPQTCDQKTRLPRFDQLSSEFATALEKVDAEL